jgi:predicted GNAT family acetyltransferase
MKSVVVHRPEIQAFVMAAVADSGEASVATRAVCAYSRQGDTLVLHHTEVPLPLQGQGLAAVLVQAALDWARAERLQVRPVCSYVAAYMRRHPDTLDLLKPPG